VPVIQQHIEMQRILFAFSVALICFAGIPYEAVGQAIPSGGVAVYTYAEPGRPTIEVSIWGNVRTPGLYLVEPGTDLLDMLTLAGGPTLGADNAQTRTSVRIMISRGQAGARERIYESEAAQLSAIDMGGSPQLLTGDIITVQVHTRPRFGWRDGLTVLGAAGSIAGLILNVIRINRESTRP
jgi:hypothetical protein